MFEKIKTTFSKLWVVKRSPPTVIFAHPREYILPYKLIYVDDIRIWVLTA